MQRIRSKEEHYLQKEIVQELRFNNIFVCAIPNGESRDKKQYYSKKARQWITYSPTGKKLKEEGVLAGAPDLFILTQDDIYFIEIKIEKGKQSPSQKEFQKNINILGHKYFIWRSLEDTKQFIKKQEALYGVL